MGTVQYPFLIALYVDLNNVDSLSRNEIYEKAARGLIKNLKDPYAE